MTVTIIAQEVTDTEYDVDPNAPDFPDGSIDIGPYDQD